MGLGVSRFHWDEVISTTALEWSETALEDDDFFLIQLNHPRLAVILGGGFK